MDFDGLAKILLRICEKFNQSGVDYVLGGGFAVILHGMPRLTDDIDLFVEPSPENVCKIKRALMAVFNDEAIEEMRPTDVEEYSVVRYGTPEGFYLDFIGKIGDKANFSTIKKGLIYLEVENVQIPVCGIETMLWLKKKTIRPIDQQDVRFLKEKLNQKKKLRK
jgi:hypothetical protein